MNILIVTWDYPDRKRSVFPFVKNLVKEWANQGHKCTVIAPYSINANKGCVKFCSNEKSEKGVIRVLRPYYLSFSNLTLFGIGLTDYYHKKAVNRALSSLKEMPDVVYCHFWNSAFESYHFAQKHQLPLFVATGESTLGKIVNRIPKGINDYIKGIIAVSSKNRDESIKIGFTRDIYKVIPNAVDSKLFKKLDSIACRKLLGFPSNVYIIVFVGWFNERKGSKRVEAAIKQINGEQVYSVFIGNGDKEPDLDGILFKGSLHHEEIPEYLNAADVFVLPTLNEGCCNAVVEAMACGLPIISSNLPFNRDVCDETNSILVDPNDINAIKSAIIKLRDNRELRNKLSIGAISKAKSLTIDQRASSIINFMQEQLNK